jgi:hypothetical protein
MLKIKKIDKNVLNINLKDKNVKLKQQIPINNFNLVGIFQFSVQTLEN